MEFKMWTLSESGSGGQIKTRASVESDIIVPDSKPDIYRILNVKAVADLSEYHIRKDKITFSGNIKYVVFYIGEEEGNKIYTIEYSAPFSHMTECSKLSEESTTKCSCSVSKTLFDVKNSRKLSVGALLDIKAEGTGAKDIQAIQNEDIPSSLAYKSEDCVYDTLKSSSEFEFDISDTITLDAGEDFEIYDIQINNDVSEIKAVNNKAVIKGQANVFVLYFSDGEIQGYNTEIPFTEIVDIDNLSSEQTLVSHFETSMVNYSVSDLTEQASIDIVAKIRGSIWGYEQMDCSLVKDMYSPDYTYDIRFKKCFLSKILSARDTKITLKDTLTVSDSSKSISKVHYADCNAVVDSYSVIGEQLKISGNLESVVIYSDSSDNLCRIGEIAPFETELDFPGADETSSISLDLSCVGTGYVLSSPMEVQMRTVARVKAVAFGLKEQQVISGFSLDENAPVKKEEQPSIVIYYPDSDSKLWNIAKKYNTTCEEIISVNSLDKENPIVPGVPIIIPKKCAK